MKLECSELGNKRSKGREGAGEEKDSSVLVLHHKFVRFYSEDFLSFGASL
jgi:hypothetical protein